MKSIAHLGPSGTYSEVATIAYAEILREETGEDCCLSPYPSIAQTLYSVASQESELAVVPVENSIQGSVAVTMDTIWALEKLGIQQCLELPVYHNLLSRGKSLAGIKSVYSHPQALGQCQKWLEKYLPNARLLAANSTTEAAQQVNQDPTSGAIASRRAAQLYDLPILAEKINDHPDNCTRFWVVGLEPSQRGSYISLAFSFQKNIPGLLVKPLQLFAHREINLTRIESRPTKRLFGEYIFFLELEGNMAAELVRDTLRELSQLTDKLRIFGNYDVLKLGGDHLPGKAEERD